MKRTDLRNLAIIAHVDHGKTTLVDKILQQTNTFAEHKEVEKRVMDSNPLEKERGITILSKNTAVHYKDVDINIVDTPGHADFGGEVERILNMVDGVLLLVDAFEGPMPQTKFVLRKSLSLGLKPIVVINKVDRPNSRPEEVLDLVFDLFVELNASEDQLDFPYVFSSAKQGFAMNQLGDPQENLDPLLDLILDKIPIPNAETEAPFQMLITDIQYDTYLGRLILGRIHQGKVSTMEKIARVDPDGKISAEKVNKLFRFQGLDRIEAESAQAGDIVLIAGIPDGTIGETLAHPDNPIALPSIKVDAPTVSMNFRINDSPFAGLEGKFVTSRHLRERLYRELLSNIALNVEDTEFKDELKVSGRGELHLSILIETMRREGYEFAVSKASVIFKTINGKVHEPFEELTLEVPEESMGPVLEELGRRKADIQGMDPTTESTMRITGKIPTRGLIGFRSILLNMTRGEGLLSHVLLGYEPFIGETTTRTHGVLIALEPGDSSPYALWKLQERGFFIIEAGIPVYAGMVVGGNARETDLIINVCTNKKLSNVRASGKDDAIRLTPPRLLSLEQALEFINDDELVEVTSKSIRLRKRILDENERKSFEKKKKAKAS